MERHLSLMKNPNYRDWETFVNDVKIPKDGVLYCSSCESIKQASEMSSKKTCKSCRYKASRLYLLKVGTAKGKYWQLSFSAKKRGIKFTILPDEFISWYDSQEKKCVYCDKAENEIGRVSDVLDFKSMKLSIDRVDNEKGYETGNLALACQRCNTIKGNFFTKEEMIEIGQVIKKKRLNRYSSF